MWRYLMQRRIQVETSCVKQHYCNKYDTPMYVAHVLGGAVSNEPNSSCETLPIWDTPKYGAHVLGRAVSKNTSSENRNYRQKSTGRTSGRMVLFHHPNELSASRCSSNAPYLRQYGIVFNTFSLRCTMIRRDLSPSINCTHLSSGCAD